MAFAKCMRSAIEAKRGCVGKCSTWRLRGSRKRTQPLTKEIAFTITMVPVPAGNIRMLTVAEGPARAAYWRVSDGRLSRGAATECSPGREPGAFFRNDLSPGGAKESSQSFAPPGLRSTTTPTPGSPGATLCRRSAAEYGRGFSANSPPTVS